MRATVINAINSDGSVLIDSAFIDAQRIRCRADASSRKHALEQLSQLLADGPSGFSAAEIFSSLNQRERLGSTCLGNGVALPHCRLPNLTAPVAALLLLNEPVDFDGEDSDVRVVLGVLLPENDERRELAPIARALRAERNLSALLNAADPRAAASIVNTQAAEGTDNAAQ
jgi:PTS system nitrogen regulatory IIA component